MLRYVLIYSFLLIKTDLFQANKNHIQDLQTAHEEYISNSKDQAARLQRAEEKVKELEARTHTASQRAFKAEASLAGKEAEREAVQTELDDLLMVFGDLEEKVARYKEQLKVLGHSVSDGEDEEDDVD